MLRIRDEQMAVFHRDSLARFYSDLSRRIEANYPRQYAELGEAGVAKHIREAIDLGGRHGITTEGAVSILAELMLEFGNEFERSPEPAWGLGILNHPDLPGSMKVDVIRDKFASLSLGRTIVPYQWSS